MYAIHKGGHYLITCPLISFRCKYTIRLEETELTISPIIKCKILVVSNRKKISCNVCSA